VPGVSRHPLMSKNLEFCTLFLNFVICKYNLDLQSIGMLRSIDWQFITDVSEHPIETSVRNNKSVCCVTAQKSEDLVCTAAEA